MKRRVKKQIDNKNVVSISFVIFLLDKLANALYNALINGVFGHIFTSYKSEQNAYSEGQVTAYFKGTSKSRAFFRRVREKVSGAVETSLFLGKLRSGISALAHIPVKIYGRFFLSFGVYTLLVYFIKALLPSMGKPDDDYLVIGLAMCIITVPLHFTRLTLAKAVRYGRIPSTLFVEGFGFRDESFEGSPKHKHKGTGAAVILGLVAGVATFAVHPFAILMSMLAFVLVVLIVNTPEIGVLISIFFLPFLLMLDHPTAYLAAILLTTTVSYVIKLIRGKRIFKLELIDLFVIVFMVLIYMSGNISVGGEESHKAALLACVMMTAYFLIKNLVKTERWLKRCVLAFVGSGTIIAAYGVLQYVLGYAVNDWIDTTYFTDIYGRATSVFDNPNYLAAYLCAVFPFALYCTCSRNTAKERALYMWASILIAACVVFTWSRGAWIAIILSTVVFFMMRSRKTVRYIVAAIFALPVLYFVLPDNIVNRFMSIGNLADSSTLYRVYTWLGSIRMAKDYLWGGIGFGESAFSQVYPSYSYAGIEGAVHSHSLYIQILISMGIGGLICFAIIMFLFAQKSFEYIKQPYNDNTRTVTAAALMSIFAMLIMGLFDYVWYNYTVFFAFWLVMAISVTAVSVGNREAERSRVSCDEDDYSAFVDIDCNY